MSDDPVKRAQALSAPELPKRFYEKADLQEESGAYQLVLDGRAARTPAKRKLAVGRKEFATLIAKEWDAQGRHIDPSKMPYTRLANAAIDGVSEERNAVAESIAKYAESDLLYYREAETEGLIARQKERWDPVLDRFTRKYGVRFNLVSGIQFASQEPATLAWAEKAVSMFKDDALALAGLQVMTSLSGSVFLALDAASGYLSAEESWSLAHLDEDWNIELWGEDEEASQRRKARWYEFQAAYDACKSV